MKEKSKTPLEEFKPYTFSSKAESIPTFNDSISKMPLKKNGETLSKQSARCTLVEDLEKTKASNTQPDNEDTQTIMG